MLPWLMNLFGVTDPAVQTLALSGAFSFLGVLITGIIAIATWAGNQWATRREKRLLREERHRDLRMALWAEISEIWQFLLYIDPEKRSADTIRATFQKAGAAGESYTPYVSAPPETLVFDVLKSDFVLLDADEINPATKFYRHLQMMVAFAGDLRGSGYKRLADGRKMAMLLHYLRMMDVLQDLAAECLRILEWKIVVARENRMAAVKERLNASRGQRPTGP